MDMSQAIGPNSRLAKVMATASEPRTWGRTEVWPGETSVYLGGGESGVERQDGQHVDGHDHNAGDCYGPGQVLHWVLVAGLVTSSPASGPSSPR